MLVIMELDRNAELERLAVAYETLHLRLSNNLKPEWIKSFGEQGYEAMRYSDENPDIWCIAFYKKGKSPKSIKRACDDRCILSDDGITWIRRSNDVMWEGLGKLFSPQEKKKEGS